MIGRYSSSVVKGNHDAYLNDRMRAVGRLAALLLVAVARAQDYQDPDPLDLLLNQDEADVSDNRTTARLPEKQFWIQSELQVPRWEDASRRQFQQQLRQGLTSAVALALARQQARHLGQKEAGTSELESRLEVQILNITRHERSTKVTVVYTVRHQGWYVPASVILEDFKLVPLSELSSYVGYPVLENSVYTSPGAKDQASYWIVWVVVGVVLSILLCGWLMLCAYYNTCGRAMEESVGAIDKQRKETMAPSSGSEGKQPAHRVYPDIAPLDIKPQRIILKEDTVQTDITAKMLENRLDMHFIEEPSEPFYAKISKAGGPKHPTDAAKTISHASRDQDYLAPDSEIKKQRFRRTDRAEKAETSPQPAVQSLPEPDKPQPKELDVTDAPPAEQAPKRAEIAQLLGANAKWTPHQAADQMERIFHITESLTPLPTTHPRPMAAAEPGGALEFHSRQLHPSPALRLNNDQIIHQFYMDSLQHIVPNR